MEVCGRSVEDDNTFRIVIDTLLNNYMASEKLLDIFTLRNESSGRAMQTLAKSLLLRSHERREVGSSWVQPPNVSGSVRRSFSIISYRTLVWNDHHQCNRAYHGRSQTHRVTSKNISTGSLGSNAKAKVEFCNNVGNIVLNLVVRNTERYSYGGKGYNGGHLIFA